MDTKRLQLKKLQEGNTTRYLLLDHTDAAFVINELLYDILSRYQQSFSYDLIVEEVNQKHGINYITAPFIDQVLKSTQQKLAVKDLRKPQEDFIKLKIKLIREGEFKHVYKFLAPLFNRYVFSFLTTISFCLIAAFIFTNRLFSATVLYQKSITTLSVQHVALVYLVMLGVIIFHEIGHASASTYYKVRPKEIGFGFYFVFPVFFSNVTNIWQLDKNRRNIVNLAGVYFQLLINSILIVLYYCNIAPPVIFALVITNLGSMLGSMIPFFRYDGYWIYSDSFNLPNLKKDTQLISIKLLFYGSSKFITDFKRLPKSLVTYITLNTFFWLYVYYSVMVYLISNAIKLQEGLANGSLMKDQMTINDTLFTIASICLIIYLLMNHLIHIFKLIRHERIGIFNREKQIS